MALLFWNVLFRNGTHFAMASGSGATKGHRKMGAEIVDMPECGENSFQLFSTA